MIIILTGQPNSGKTTLALELTHYLHEMRKDVTDVVIDGDTLRTITKNVDYSKDGRRKNVQNAINLAINSDINNDYTVVALVSPFRDLRESLKNNNKHVVKEIYLHSSRLREGKMVDYYEPPIENFLLVDTDKNNIKESLNLIINYIQQKS
jgi:adenylylsulfate kinase-like enzyme